MNSDRVGDFAHDAAEGVNFPDQMAFCNSTDGRITGHLRDQVNIQRVKRGLQAHARARDSGLAAGMSCSDDYDVELFGELHPHLFYRAKLKRPFHQETQGHRDKQLLMTAVQFFLMSVNIASCHWSDGKYQSLAPAS